MSNKLKLWSRLLVVFVILLLMITFETTATVEAEEMEEYVLVGAFLEHPVFRMLVREFTIVGEEMGVRTTIAGPPDWNLDLMREAMEQVVALKPDGIIIFGFDETFTPLIDKAMDAGIPVATIDSDLPNSKRICFVGSDWVAIGQELAKGIINATGAKGEIGCSINLGQTNMQTAIESFKVEIAKNPDMKIVSIQDDKSIIEEANNAAAFMLQAYPNLAGIVGFDGSSGGGICPAVKEAGKAGIVKVSIIDSLADHLLFLKEGTAQFVLGQKHGVFATNALKMLYEVNHSSVFFTSDDRSIGLYPIPEVMYTGFLEITPENIDLFIEAMEKDEALANQ